jgi:5-methylcytosine-specific restriction endonuclease McrA
MVEPDAARGYPGIPFPELIPVTMFLEMKWTEEEDEILRRLWPRDLKEAVFTALPGRTPKSVGYRAELLGVRRTAWVVPERGTRATWTDEENATLVQEWPGYTPLVAILAKLPGRTRGSVIAQAQKLGVSRPRDLPHPGKVASVHSPRDGVEGKNCSKCDDWKPLNEFREMSVGKWADGRNACCKGCESEYQRRPEQKEKNATFYRENSEMVRARGKAWRLTNPEAFKAARKNSEAKRRGAMVGSPGVSKEEREYLWFVFDGKCAYCGRPATTEDHVVPLARGGAHAIGNLLPACKPCNSRKRELSPEEWERKLMRLYETGAL